VDDDEYQMTIDQRLQRRHPPSQEKGATTTLAALSAGGAVSHCSGFGHIFL
jgi:hypothetical protein